MTKRSAGESLQQIKATGLVAILRHVKQEQLPQVAEALYAGGVRCVEVTANSENAVACVQWLSEQWGERMMIGAGTVIRRQDVRLFGLAGADFILSPVYDEVVMSEALEAGLLPVPGIYTPSEAMQAVRQMTAAGLEGPLVKLFPAVTVGPEYIIQVRAPLPDLHIMAVGGIDAHNAAAFVDAGAAVLGVGSQLADPQLIDAGNFAMLQARAAVFVAAVRGKDKRTEGALDE